MLTVQEFITPNPDRIDVNEPLAEAHRMMQARGSRHLAVVDGEHLVGIVSLHDLHFAEREAGARAARRLTVRAAMVTPFIVAPDAHSGRSRPVWQTQRPLRH